MFIHRAAPQPSPLHLLIALVTACGGTWGGESSGGQSGKGGGGGGGSSGGGSSVECGWNASPDGDGGCECDGKYTFCEGSDTECCAYDTNTFRVTVVEAGYLPWADARGQEPWDWDGDIPDWLIDAMELIGYAVPEAATMAEVLDLIDEYAPELLEGVVPPDPFFEVYVGSSLLDVSNTVDDDYNPRFNTTFKVTLSQQRDLTLAFYDEDLTFNDDADSFFGEVGDLQELAGLGEVEIPGSSTLFNVTIEVEPVW